MRSMYIAFATAFIGCEGAMEVPPPPPTPPPVAPAPFEAEVPEGPRLYMTGSLEADNYVVTLWAESLGPVFGLGGALRFDPEHLELLSPSQAAPLGEPDGGPAIYILREDTGALTFGGSRRNVDLGEVDLDAKTKLLELRFRARADGESRVELRRVIVRRADGTYTLVNAGAATLRSHSGGNS